MPYEADILVEPPEAVFDPLTDIKEVIGDQQPGGGEAFKLDGGEATLVYEISAAKRRSFLRWALGFAVTTPGGATTRLKRENPQCHPVFPWLYADTVSFSSFPPKIEGGHVYTDAVFPEEMANGSTITKTTNWQVTYATIRFRDFPWNFLGDGQIAANANEIERNCYFETQPQVEQISAEGPLGQLLWSETAAGGPTVGQAIQAPFGTLLAKTSFILNLVHYPHEFLSAPGLFFPTNILSCVGRVNSQPFPSVWASPFPAGTLLMMPPKFHRFRWPVSTYLGIDGFYGYNVSIPFVYFDPDRGGADRGWRTMPWAPQLLFYGCTRLDPTKRLLSEADPNVIFNHV